MEETSPSKKVATFEHIVIDSFLAPRIALGKEMYVEVHTCITELQKRMTSLEHFSLPSAEMGLVRSWDEIHSAWMALAGEAQDCVKHNDELQALDEEIGTQNQSMLHTVAIAVSQAPFYTKMLKQRVDAMAAVA